MLYKNILKHEPGFDYEFEEGTIVNITDIDEDEFGDLDFYIDGQLAHSTLKEFRDSWIPAYDIEQHLRIFRTAFNSDAPDDELEKIIDEAANNIEDAREYSKFYEIVTDMVRMR